MQALILAGGKGTRLRPITVNTPKPIVPIANRSFLLYQLDLLKRAGITDVILSLSYQPKKIEDVLGDGSDFGVHISYTVEAQPLGTAGAFKNAQAHLRERTIVLNGDILTDLDLNVVLKQHRSTEALATIVLAPVENPTVYGVVEADADGRVKRFLEKPKPEEIACNTINAGIYILEPKALEMVPDEEHYSFEYGLFPDLLKRKEAFYAYVTSAYWLDIGTPARYLQAHHDLLDDKLASYRIPPRERGDKIDKSVQIDEKSLIDPSTVIKSGSVIVDSVIGPNCFIEEKVVIEDSVVLSGTRLGHGVELKNAVIGKSCLIGRFSQIDGFVAIGDKSMLTDYTVIVGS